ncbi:MAG TPA: pentapeptide repeat-containing protein [Streptosporangiaceae bacterium]
MSRAAAGWPADIASLPYGAHLTGHEGGLVDGGDYDTVHFDQVSFENENASSARFLECAFTRVSLQGGRFRRSRFSDVWLKDVRMTLPDLAETEWKDATFLGGLVSGVQAFSARLTRVVFAGCKLDSVNFRDCDLTDVTFTDCLLSDVDFGGARLTRTVFAGSRLTGVDFSKTSLDRVDLRGSELGLIVGPGPLRGAIISSGQLATIAPVLADALGIVVDDG